MLNESLASAFVAQKITGKMTNKKLFAFRIMISFKFISVLNLRRLSAQIVDN